MQWHPDSRPIRSMSTSTPPRAGMEWWALPAWGMDRGFLVRYTAVHVSYRMFSSDVPFSWTDPVSAVVYLQVEIEVPRACGFVMRTSDCTLSEVSVMDPQGQPVYTKAPGSEAFRAAMEKLVKTTLWSDSHAITLCVFCKLVLIFNVGLWAKFIRKPCKEGQGLLYTTSFI